MASSIRRARVLYSGVHDPSVIPPPLLTTCQVTTIPRNVCNKLAGPNLDPEMSWVIVSGGRYNLAEELQKNGIEPEFDLVIVQADASKSNLPYNLSNLDCPRVLLVGDTHHMRTPIRSMVDYALSESFHGIASTYDKHHLHWFSRAGCSNLAWFPGLGVPHISRNLPSERASQVCFTGTMDGTHRYRMKLLKSLRSENIPLVPDGVCNFGKSAKSKFEKDMISRTESSTHYNQSAISLNCSLNGDLNLRVFEVLSAGGFLLTDELSTESGLEELFHIGEHLETYSTSSELLEKIRFYLRNPTAAAKIAEAGHRAFCESHTPAIKGKALLDWALNGKLDSRYSPSSDRRNQTPPESQDALSRRISTYEKIQERHRCSLSTNVLLVGERALTYASDLCDLPRLTLFATTSHINGRQKTLEGALRDRVTWISHDECRNREWDFIIFTGTRWERIRTLRWHGRTYYV